MTTATQSEFAALIGRNKSHVTRLKQAGRLVLTDDGLVDVEKSQKLIAMTADPSRADAVAARDQARASLAGDGGADTGSPAPERAAQLSQAEHIGNSYQGARALKEKYNALTAKLEFEQASGKLVEADAARLFAADLAATFRGALEILPDRIAPELVELSDTETIRAVLVESFEQILTDLADKIKKWGEA